MALKKIIITDDKRQRIFFEIPQDKIKLFNSEKISIDLHKNEDTWDDIF